MARPTEIVENFERWEMPAGYSVYYRDSDHAYFWEVKGKKGGGYSGADRLVGVSGASGVVNLSKDGLMDWACRETLASTADHIWQTIEGANGDVSGEALEWAASGESIWEYLRENKATWRHRRRSRATEGSQAHHVLEVALADSIGNAKKMLDQLTDDDYGFAKAAIDFVETEKPEVLQTEQVVASRELNCAGRFDARLKVRGGVAILDAKTKKRDGTMESNHAQLAGYQLLAEQAGFGATPKAYVLNLYDDGKYQLYEGQGTADDFRAALSAYTAARDLSKRIRAESKRAMEQVT